MRTVFADTSFFIALLDEDDECHRLALLHGTDEQTEVVTTDWVLAELANYYAARRLRPSIRSFIDALGREPNATILPATRTQFQEGLRLYDQRPDKAWSLTDCISFAVMREQGLADALTADHHFEQAGFNLLL